MLVIAANTGEPTTRRQVQDREAHRRSSTAATRTRRSSPSPVRPTPTSATTAIRRRRPIRASTSRSSPTASMPTPPADAPEIAPGDTVTWTYKVTNTGNVAFTASRSRRDRRQRHARQHGRRLHADARHFQRRRQRRHPLARRDVDLHGQRHRSDLLTPGAASTFNFSGSTCDRRHRRQHSHVLGRRRLGENQRIQPRQRAASGRPPTSAATRGGLGVTDSSEGTAAATRTRSTTSAATTTCCLNSPQTVVIDSAFLGYVVGDSDLTVWIGSKHRSVQQPPHAQRLGPEQPRLHRSQ